MNLNPTEAQKEAGNYKKRHMKIHGLDIAIENPRGSERFGVSKDGTAWSCTMADHYGYLKRTEGADGDHVDCFIGKFPTSNKVFIVDQNDLNGKFDEHKCLLGYRNLKEAKDGYVKSFSDGKGEARIDYIVEMTMPRFKEWLKNDNTKKPSIEVVPKYATGGAVPMADGGVAGAFDDLLEAAPAVKETPRHRAPEAAAFLSSIAGSESPDYQTIYGGQKFNSFADHPRIPVPIRTGPNTGNVSSAAGRYQFLAPTWDQQRKKLNLSDFSPENQDLAAWDLAETTYKQKTQRDLLTDLQSRDPKVLQQISQALSGVWTSLPGGIEPNAMTNSFAQRYLASLQPQDEKRLPAQAMPVKFVKNEQQSLPDISGAFDELLAEETKTPEKKEQPPKTSVGNAVRLGLSKGISGNLADEITGLQKANPADDVMKNIPVLAATSPIAGALALGKDWLTGSEDATKRYETGRDQLRAEISQAEKDRPIVTGVSELAGAIALPFGAATKGATLGQQAKQLAKVGAITGGIYGFGEGEGLEDRLARTTIGTGVGAITGAATPYIMKGLGIGYNAIKSRLPQIPGVTERGLTQKGAEKRAEEFLASVPDKDALTLPVFNKLQSEGFPVARIDTMGPEAYRAAQWASNVNPTARQMMLDFAAERKSEKNQRAMDWLTNLVRTPANAHLTREELQAVLEKAQEPAYKVAMRFGEKGIDHPEFERLMLSPKFEAAMKTAQNKFLDLKASGRNHGEGFMVNMPPSGQVMKPVLDDQGKMKWVPDDIQPEMAGKFTLEYWDLVKKSLDDKIGAAVNSGEKNEVANLVQMKKKLVSVLDEATTVNGKSLYRDARGIHASFRGADNAIEFGEGLARQPMEPNQLRSYINKAKQEEKMLAAEGFVSDLKRQLGEGKSLNQVFKKSPYRKDNLEQLLGPLGAREVQARLMVEKVMDRLPQAISGQSSTARQLVELGLLRGAAPALGTLSVYASDPYAAGYAGLTAALAYGSQRANQRVARIVAEKLLSQDPKIVQQGFNQLRNNKTLLQNLTNYENALTKYLALNPPAANALNPVKADQEPTQ